MNGLPEKTIRLFENEILKKKSVELDPISATCVLNACSDCHRLDIGEYVHHEIQRLKLLNRDNIRLATAVSRDLSKKCLELNCNSFLQAYGYVLQLQFNRSCSSNIQSVASLT